MVRRLKRRSRRRRRKPHSNTLEQRLKLPWFSLSDRKTTKLREYLKNGQIELMIELFKQKKMAKSDSPIDRMIRYYIGRKYSTSYQPVFDYVIDRPLSFHSLAWLGARGSCRAGVLRQLVSGRFDEQLPELIDLLGKKNRWAMVDYLHLFGYRGSSQLLVYSHDREHLKQLIEFGYTVDYRLFKKLIQKFDLSIMIDEREHLERLFDDRKSRPVLLTSISNLTPTVYRKLEAHSWFGYRREQIRAVIKRKNIPLLQMMIDRFGVKLTIEEQKILFNIPLVKRRWKRSIYSIWSPFTAENTADYRKLIETVPKLPRGVLIRAVRSDSIDLIESISRFESEFRATEKRMAITFIIRNDSRKMADKLIELKMLAPIDFCRTECVTWAVFYQAVQILRYLLVDLRVGCTPTRISQMFPQIRTEKRKRVYASRSLLSIETAVDMIRVLVDAGIKPPNTLLDIWSESITLLRRLRPLNIGFGRRQYLHALKHGWFESAMYLSEKYEFNDRVRLSTLLTPKTRWSYLITRFNWTTTSVRKIVARFNVVVDRASLMVTVKVGLPKIFHQLIKEHHLVPDLPAIRKRLLDIDQPIPHRDLTAKPVERIIETVVDKYALDLSDITPSKLATVYRTDKVVEYLDRKYAPTYTFDDLCISQLSVRMINLIFARGFDLTFEQFNEFASFGTGHLLLKEIAKQPLSFKEQIGRAELHRVIMNARNWWTDSRVMVYLEEFGIEPSPYTLELILSRNENSYIDKEVVEICLDRLEAVTERAVEMCPQPRWRDGWLEVRTRLEQADKIDYQPTEDELVDQPVFERAFEIEDDDDDDDDDEVVGVDQLEQLMAEA